VRLSITRDMEMDMKEVIVNIFFREVTLRHVVGSDWLFKMIDLVEEPDMPGLGHDFAAKFSKIVVALSNISIDYKPVCSRFVIYLFILCFVFIIVIIIIIPGRFMHLGGR
jgi:hypothetical protein